MYRNGSIDTHICIQKAYFWILWPLSLYPLLISCHICFTQVTISLLAHKYVCSTFLNIAKKLPEDPWKGITLWFACVLYKTPSECVLYFNVQTSKAVHLCFYCCHVSSKHSLFIHMWHFSVVWTKIAQFDECQM